MNDINAAEMKKELADKLIASGVSEEEAKQTASKEIDSLGVIKTTTGQCPLDHTSPMACMFCHYGHMTNCHYPLSCAEANCSHFQEEVANAGEYAGYLEEQ
jgi:hypothetical protein